MIRQRVRDDRTGDVYKIVSESGGGYLTLFCETTRAVRYEPLSGNLDGYSLIDGVVTEAEHRADVVAADRAAQRQRAAAIRAARDAARAPEDEYADVEHAAGMPAGALSDPRWWS